MPAAVRKLANRSLAERNLKDLRGIGRAMLKDFEMLGVRSVAQLAHCDGDDLYNRLCDITHTRMDPCVHDTFVCAIEQARNPGLAPEKCDWWYWSAVRKRRGGIVPPPPPKKA